ncbi:UNVERIFIED_ORG: hypothetical protein M2435_002074 [Rhizobium sophorae]|uniref:hypothetical protein n=2 Tax=Rhizobium/Agrobacterium group TaxID=227290 RepID=UPI0017CEFFEA|nr:hypothetical protein [Rhizobium leguminosarum]MBB4522999.1 hypothetical protein [Rhizobium leguminosarum]MDH6659165.1 hypothetical protein [Rhizobium sophorae]
MSIEGHSTAPGANVIVEHYCEHRLADGTRCKEWGGWGNSPSPAVPTRWWCWEHFPHKTFEQEQALRRKLEAAGGEKIIQSERADYLDIVEAAYRYSAISRRSRR